MTARPFAAAAARAALLVFVAALLAAPAAAQPAAGADPGPDGAASGAPAGAPSGPNEAPAGADGAANGSPSGPNGAPAGAAPGAMPGAVGEGERHAGAIDELFAEWDRRATTAERALASHEASTAAFEVLRDVLAGHRAAARDLADLLEADLRPLRAQLDSLGPAPEDGAGEAEGVAAERRQLRQRIAAIEARARRAELARARADTAIDRIDALIRERFAEELLARGPSPLDPALWPQAVAQSVEVGRRVANEVAFALRDTVRSRERAEVAPFALLALAVSPVLVLWGRRKAVALIRDRLAAGSGRMRRVGAAALAALVRAAALGSGFALFMVGLRQLDLLGPTGTKLLEGAGVGLGVLVASRVISLAWYAPDAPALRISEVDDAHARNGSRLALLLGLLFLAQMILVHEGPAIGLGARALAVLNLVLLAPAAVTLWSLARLLTPETPPEPAEGEEAQTDPPGRRVARLGTLALKGTAILSVLLSLAGYFAASRYALLPPAVTLGLVGLGLVLFHLLNEAVEAYLQSRALGREELRLLPVFFGFLLFCAGLPVLALIWGARSADLAEAWDVIVAGVSIGDVRLAPVDLLTFLMVFGIGYTLTRLFQAVLDTSVLPKTRLDTGGRTALVSGVGYVGVAIASLAAISAAGLDLSNLAIVAGALSVGIGFGLQTIVNNFVSGLILLVERPVQVGDWIEVGGVHGTVRKINVRATEIQTFDRSSLILPNSELIAGRVTNYTHGSPVGRLIVPVGVAYGSDVRKVEAILKEVAEADSRVSRYPAPQVLFMSFGADSLDFELRVILRDVNTILATRSDLHFEIDRRFREADIEIPFAQRVVHLKGPEAPPAAPHRPGRAAENDDTEAPDLDTDPDAPSDSGEGR